jgi:hypothetical protein
MLTTVEVRTRQGTLMVLPLEDISSGLIVADIQGLDPVKAVIVSSSFAQLDGAQYQSSKREPRNILMKLELEPDFITTHVRDLRNQIYAFFMPKREVNLRFYDSSGSIVDIWGRVEYCQSPLFAKESEVDISILCMDPDFIDQVPVEVPGNTVSDSTEFLIDYDGTVETGLEFVLNVNRVLTEFTIYHRPPNDTVRSLEFIAPLQDLDVLTITTVPGAKEVKLTRGGVDTPLLYGVTPQSNWIELVQGENYLSVYASGAAVPFNITYVPRYGGL